MAFYREPSYHRALEPCQQKGNHKGPYEPQEISGQDIYQSKDERKIDGVQYEPPPITKISRNDSSFFVVGCWVKISDFVRGIYRFRGVLSNE